MSYRSLLFGLALPIWGWSQPLSQECEALRKQVEAFTTKHIFLGSARTGTLKDVEQELGTAQLEPGETLGNYRAIYTQPGCVGRVLIDAHGIAWTAEFKAVPVMAPPHIKTFEQLQAIDQELQKLKTQIDGMETVKAALIRQGVATPPTAPEPDKVMPESSAIGDADAIYMAGRFDEAVEAFTKILSGSPLNSRILLRRGYCFHRLGKLNEAIRDYGESIRLEPNVVAYNNRAIAYLGIGQLEPALADFRQATSSQGQNAASTGGSGVSGTGGTVNVKGYTRKDGTYVAPYTRSAPRKK